MEAFPRGMLRAVSENRYDNQRAEVLNIWSGNELYIEATQEQRLPDGQGSDSATVQKVFQVYGEREANLLTENARLLQVVRDGSMTGWKILKLRPKDCWFRMSIPDDITWAKYLRSCLDSESDDIAGAIVFKAKDDLEVRMRHKPSSSTSSVSFSMQQGGNVVAFEFGGGAGSGQTMRRGLMEWSPTDDGRWFLKRYESQMGTGSSVDFRRAGGYFVTVTEFDPNPDIPKDRFLRSSLPLKPGMMVKEYGANQRTYRLGSDTAPEQGISEQQFQLLTEELGKKGFGDRARNLSKGK